MWFDAGLGWSPGYCGKKLNFYHVFCRKWKRTEGSQHFSGRRATSCSFKMKTVTRLEKHTGDSYSTDPKRTI